MAQLDAQRQRVDAIIANVPGVVWETSGEADGSNLRMSFVSGYVKEMLGYSAEEWLSTPKFWLNIVFPEDRDLLLQTQAEQFASGKGGVSTFRFVTKQGRVIWVESYSSPVCDSDGHCIGMRGVSLDITKRKQIEQEREELLGSEQAAHADAESARQALDEFIGVIAHELRNHLNAVTGWVRLTRSGRLDQAGSSHALEVIDENVKVQVRLIKDLLDSSRIAASKLQLCVEEVDLSQLVTRAADQVRPIAEAKGVHLAQMVEPCRLFGDDDRLEQVVMNLLSNAIKFTPGGGKVEIKVRQFGCEAEVVISDTGQGIRAEFLPHVFERFRKHTSPLTRKQVGLGLGLAIVRHLVERHGGTVNAYSAGEGQGATFTVRLPVAAVCTNASDLDRSPKSCAPVVHQRSRAG